MSMDNSRFIPMTSNDQWRHWWLHSWFPVQGQLDEQIVDGQCDDLEKNSIAENGDFQINHIFSWLVQISTALT